MRGSNAATSSSAFPSFAVNLASSDTSATGHPFPLSVTVGSVAVGRDRKLWRYDGARTALRAVLRGLRAGRRLQALAVEDHHRVRRPSLLHDHRSEEHTSELQSLRHLVCRLLLEK